MSPSATPSPTGSRLAEVGRGVLLLAPFAVGLVLQLWLLLPTEAFDGFSYLWRADFSWHFLTGRSLTQRVLFLLLGNDARWIGVFQLALWAGVAQLLYRLLRNEGEWPRTVLAAVLALFFSSYTFTVSNIYVGPEPIFLALLLAFPVVWLTVQPARHPLLLGGLAAAFLLSKNVAPFLLFPILLCGWWLRRPLGRREIWTATAAVALAAGSVVVTQRFDSSLHINALNNLYFRVFPDAQAVRTLHERDGMPIGPFVEKCAGGNALTPFDEKSLLVIDQTTRNYALRDDAVGFAAWTRQHGPAAYRRYLLADQPGRTWREFRSGLQTRAQDASIRNLSHTMLEFNRSTRPQSNRDVLEATLGHRADGLLGFDPLALSLRLATTFGLHRVEVLLPLALAGLFFSRRFPDCRTLAVGSTYLLLVPPLFFLGYFGDGMEFERHVLPALLLLALGTVLLLGAVAELLARRLSRPARRS